MHICTHTHSLRSAHIQRIILISYLLIDNACYDYLSCILWIWFKTSARSHLWIDDDACAMDVFCLLHLLETVCLFQSDRVFSGFHVFSKFTVAPRITKTPFSDIFFVVVVVALASVFVFRRFFSFVFRIFVSFSFFRCDIFCCVGCCFWNSCVAKCVLFRIQYRRTFVNWTKRLKKRQSPRWEWSELKMEMEHSYNSYRQGK